MENKILNFEEKKAKIEESEWEEVEGDLLVLDESQMSEIIDNMAMIHKCINNIKDITGLDYDEKLLDCLVKDDFIESEDDVIE